MAAAPEQAPRMPPEATTAQPATRVLPPWRRLAAHVARFGGTHTVVQGASLLAGLLFVNYLEPAAFALYTLATSLVAFTVFLSDLGVTGSLVYFAHQATREERSFDRFAAAVFGMRRIAVLAVGLLVGLLFPLVAGAEGFGGLGVWLATAALLATVLAQVEAALQLQLLRLRNALAASYRAEIVGAVLRLALALGLVVAVWLEAWTALAAGAVATAATALLARRAQTPLVLGDAPLVAERRAVLRYLLPTLPGALYFALRGQLTVWLAASFAGTQQLAEVGALGRLGLLLGFFSSFASVVVLPRLAQLRDESLWQRRVLGFGLALAGVAVSLLGLATLAPGAFLLVLGPNYRGLETELLLVVASAGVGLLDGYLVSINMARSWTRWNGLAVAVLAASQVALVWVCPLATTLGLLWFNLLSGLVALGGQLVITAVGFRRPERVAWT
jgi:O-antigen/teichoic acid export membrane protein